MTRPSFANGFFAPGRGGLPRWPQLWRGCVGAWAPCLGPSGVVLRDWSGYGNHGTLVNMSADTDWIRDSGRSCLDLDGTNDRIEVPNAVQYGTSEISFGGWVKKSSSSEGGYLIAKNNDGTSSGPGILLQSSGGLNAVCNTSFTTTSGAYIATDWSHIFVVFRNLVVEVYYNGILRDISTPRTGIGSTWPNTIPITIGARTGSTVSAVQLAGLIDDLRWYNRALSSAEIFILSLRRGIAYELDESRYKGLSILGSRRRRILTGLP